MTLEQLKEKLISTFDFEKSATFLNNNGIDITKYKLIKVAESLIENIYNDKEANSYKTSFLTLPQ